MERPAFIYALADPRTGDVRYVGKSIQLARRYRVHLHDGTDSHRGRWIRLLKSEGLRPLLYVLEGPCGDWDEAERRWITDLRAEGADLTNMTDGGDAGPPMPPEGRVGHRAAMQSPEVRARLHAMWDRPGFREQVGPKIAAAALARWADPERRAELLRAQSAPEAQARHRMIMQSREVKAKMTGRKWTPEARQKMSNYAQNRSATHRANLAAANRSRSPEVQAKIAAALKAKPSVTCSGCGKVIQEIGGNVARHTRVCLAQGADDSGDAFASSETRSARAQTPGS